MRVRSFITIAVILLLAIIAVSAAAVQASADDGVPAPFTSLLFKDDFRNGSANWNTWKFDPITEGQNAFLRSGGDLNQGIDLLRPLSVANYTFKAKFRLESTDITMKFWYRYLKNQGRTGYEVSVTKRAEDGHYIIAMQKDLGGICYRYGKKEVLLDESQPGAWHQITIEARGATINVSVDDGQLFALADDEKPILNGSSIMVTGDEGLIIDIDDVEVWGEPDDPYQPSNYTFAEGSLMGITLFRLVDAGDHFYNVVDFFPGASLTLNTGTISCRLFGSDLGLVGLALAILFDLIVVLLIVIVLAILLLRTFKRICRRAGSLTGRVLSLGTARVTRVLARSDGSAADVAGTVPGKKAANDVFVSYSHNDKAIADMICTTLEARKMKCWIAPRDVPAGQNYQESIIDAIDASRILVLVYSGASNSSPHVIREITRAVSMGVTIIPFRIENVPLSRSMEYLISLPHWMEATEPPMDDHIDRLAARARSILKGEKPADEKKKLSDRDSGEGERT